MAKNKVKVAEPAVMPEAKEVELIPAVPGLNEDVMVAPVKEAENEVRTGVDIRSGMPVMKPAKAKVKKTFEGEDRVEYVASKAGEGSLNGREFKFKAGEKLNMNVDEAKLFAAYITKAK